MCRLENTIQGKTNTLCYARCRAWGGRAWRRDSSTMGIPEPCTAPSGHALGIKESCPDFSCNIETLGLKGVVKTHHAAPLANSWFYQKKTWPTKQYSFYFIRLLTMVNKAGVEASCKDGKHHPNNIYTLITTIPLFRPVRMQTLIWLVNCNFFYCCKNEVCDVEKKVTGHLF